MASLKRGEEQHQMCMGAVVVTLQGWESPCRDVVPRRDGECRLNLSVHNAHTSLVCLFILYRFFHGWTPLCLERGCRDKPALVPPCGDSQSYRWKMAITPMTMTMAKAEGVRNRCEERREGSGRGDFSPALSSLGKATSAGHGSLWWGHNMGQQRQRGDRLQGFRQRH